MFETSVFFGTSLYYLFRSLGEKAADDPFPCQKRGPRPKGDLLPERSDNGRGFSNYSL